MCMPLQETDSHCHYLMFHVLKIMMIRDYETGKLRIFRDFQVNVTIKAELD